MICLSEWLSGRNSDTFAFIWSKAMIFLDSGQELHMFRKCMVTISYTYDLWFYLTMGIFDSDSHPHFLFLNLHIKRIVESWHLCVLSECFLVVFDASSCIQCMAHCTVCSCGVCVSGQQVQRLLTGWNIIKWHRRKWEYCKVYCTTKKNIQVSSLLLWKFIVHDWNLC